MGSGPAAGEEIQGAARAYHLASWPPALSENRLCRLGSPAQPLVSSISGFLNHGTTDILDQMINVGSAYASGNFSSIPGLYPLDPSSPDNQNVSKHCQLSSGKGESTKSLKTTSLNRSLLPRTRRCSARKKRNDYFKIPARSQILCQVLSHVIITNKSVTRVIILKGNEFEAQKGSDLSKVTKLSCPAGLQAQVRLTPKPSSFYSLLLHSTHRPKFRVQDTSSVPSTALKPSGMLSSDAPMGHIRQFGSPPLNREGC